MSPVDPSAPSHDCHYDCSNEKLLTPRSNPGRDIHGPGPKPIWRAALERRHVALRLRPFIQCAYYRGPSLLLRRSQAWSLGQTSIQHGHDSILLTSELVLRLASRPSGVDDQMASAGDEIQYTKRRRPAFRDAQSHGIAQADPPPQLEWSAMVEDDMDCSLISAHQSCRSLERRGIRTHVRPKQGGRRRVSGNG